MNMKIKFLNPFSGTVYSTEYPEENCEWFDTIQASFKHAEREANMSDRDDLVLHSQAKVIDLHNQEPNLFLPEDLVMYNLNHIDYLFFEFSSSESGRSYQSRPKTLIPAQTQQILFLQKYT